MGKHIDVVTFPRDESPFGTELPVPGFIHRVPRPGAPGGVATLVIESVEVVGSEVRAVVTTWDGPLCPAPPVGADAAVEDDEDDGAVPLDGDSESQPPTQAELFPVATDADARRSHPAGRTTPVPRRA